MLLYEYMYHYVQHSLLLYEYCYAQHLMATVTPVAKKHGHHNFGKYSVLASYGPRGGWTRVMFHHSVM